MALAFTAPQTTPQRVVTPGDQARHAMPRRESTAPSDAPCRVEVHLVRLASLRERGASLTALSEEERRFAAGIASRQRRTSFIATRLFLRQMLALRIGCQPAAVAIVLQGDGKPRLAAGGVEFSLSHTDSWIAVALSARHAVGVDIEPVRPLAGMGEIVAEFFPQAARAEFNAASPDEQPPVFFRWWTRIEAAVKASGRGLDDARACFEGMSYQSCDIVPGLAAAVAARTAGPLVVDCHLAPVHSEQARRRENARARPCNGAKAFRVVAAR